MSWKYEDTKLFYVIWPEVEETKGAEFMLGSPMVVFCRKLRSFIIFLFQCIQNKPDIQKQHLSNISIAYNLVFCVNNLRKDSEMFKFQAGAALTWYIQTAWDNHLVHPPMSACTFQLCVWSSKMIWITYSNFKIL